MKQISRRTILGTAAPMAATPAFAEGCQVGPPQHHKGPLVFMDYDQLELDASYDQLYYEPLIAKVGERLSGNSDATRARIGAPQREAYGPTEIEKLDIYRTNRPNAPVFVFFHGGNWLVGSETHLLRPRSNHSEPPSIWHHGCGRFGSQGGGNRRPMARTER